MKITFIITDYGSFNNFLSEVAIKLIETGNEVHVICSAIKVINYKDKYKYEDFGIIFHYIDFPRSFNLFKQLTISKRINLKLDEIRPDLINIHFTTGVFTTVLWKKPSFFTVGTFHGIGYPVINGTFKRLLFKTIENFCFKRLDQIFVLNNSDYKLVKKLFPDNTYKLNSCGVGCDLLKFNSFEISNAYKIALRNSLSIKPTDFVIAFTGRYVAFKGFNLVVKSVISLIERYKIYNIKLLLIGGEDNIHNTGLTVNEEAFYKANSQFVNVGFTANVNSFLSITDLFVFPSTKEGMPVCIMEALAMGVPVVTANTRGCSDLITHELNGLLLNKAPSVKEITDSILRLYMDRKLLKELSENALLDRNKLSRNLYVREQINTYLDAKQNPAYIDKLFK